MSEVCIILDIMRKPNPIIVLLYIQNSHTKMQAKCGSKKTLAINFAKFCYFVIFARFEVVTSSASKNIFLVLIIITHSNFILVPYWSIKKKLLDADECIIK